MMDFRGQRTGYTGQVTAWSGTRVTPTAGYSLFPIPYSLFFRGPR
jgi:hypothetical protein